MTELPEPVIAREECAVSSGEYYTRDQMLQFRRDALEEAARVCDEYRYEWRGRTYAQAIRKLKDET